MGKLMQLKNKQYILTIPRLLVESKKWRKGDSLVWEINELGQITLRK